MGKTKVIELTAEHRTALENGYRKGKSHAFRVRCQMILLKSEKRSSAEVSRILGCCEVVVNGWLSRYEAEGIKGLETRAGRGRKPKLSTQNPVHLQTVKAEIAKHPQSVKTVVAKLEEDLDLQMHPDTLKRFLKKSLPLLSFQDEPQVAARGRGKSRQRAPVKASVAVVFSEAHQAVLRRIKLYFGDESTFSMNPVPPYGWSPKGERVEIFPQRDKKVSLFGIFRPDNFCVTYESRANINSQFLINSIDDFCRYVDKPTVLVLDTRSDASLGSVSLSA